MVGGEHGRDPDPRDHRLEPDRHLVDPCAGRRQLGQGAGEGLHRGFEAALLSGEENADEIRSGNDGLRFLSNRAGGVLGGISSGQDVVVRFAVKPTSSILTPRKTVDVRGRETEIVTKGRHDPCVGIRAVPVGEAMMAIVLADHLLRQRALAGEINNMQARTATVEPVRYTRDEQGNEIGSVQCDAEDTVYASFAADGGMTGEMTASWAGRGGGTMPGAFRSRRI